MPIWIRGGGSATAGAGRAPLDGFQSAKEKCRPPGGRRFFKMWEGCYPWLGHARRDNSLTVRFSTRRVATGFSV